MRSKLEISLTALALASLTACGGGDPADSAAAAPSGAELAQAKSVSIGIAPTVMINEVMASNFHGATDNDGDRSDWVELYNTTAAAINLSGYGLSNKPGSPFRWVFPANATIGAKGYLRVWLSKKDRTTSVSNLHANFNLDNGADDVLLSAPNGTQLGTTLDRVSLPLTQPDVSYCRMGNGVPGSAFSFCNTPTPGNANSGVSALVMLDKPAISVVSGIYPAATTVAVTGPVGAQWRYTLDGSLPTATSALYAAPLSISSSKVLRVASFQAGMQPSMVETATYVIDSSNRFAGQRVLFVNMAPGDMSSYKGGGRTSSGWGAQVEMLDTNAIPAFHADAETSDSGQLGSRNGQNNLPMDIKFKDALGAKNITYPIFTAKPNTSVFKRFKLRNSGDDYWWAHLRDQFWQSLLAEKVAPGAASEPVHVFTNGQYYGMMDLREKEDETLIESTYGVDKDTVDYVNQTTVLNGENAWDNYTAMRSTINGNDMAVAANYEKAKSQLDMENFAQDFALHMFAADRDWLWRNMHFFRMPAYDGKWRYRPHDIDISSGGKNKWGYNTAVTQNMNDYYGNNDAGGMMSRLLKNAEFRALYINVIADQMNSTLSPAATNARLTTMAQSMQPYMPVHYAAFSNAGSVAQWNQSVADLRSFLTNRASYYDQHTQAEFALGPRKSVNLSVNDPAMGTVKINTIDLSTKLSAATPVWTGAYYPQVPVVLQALPKPGYVFVGWQGASTSTQTQISAAITVDSTAYTAQFAKAASVAAPAVTAAGSLNNLTGDTVAYQVTATDPLNLKLTYSAKKLPSGLSIHADTGMVYGQPTKSGVYATTVTASNGKASQTANISWTIVNRGDRVVSLPTGVTGDGLGLAASYFNNATLAGTPLITRTELPTVNVGGGTALATGFGTSKWSVRWDGYLEAPVAGVYNLQSVVNSNDGVRVYVNGNLVIDNWTQPSTVAKQVASVVLAADAKTAIRIEYWDAAGAASLQMHWMLPGSSAYSPMTIGVFSTTP